MLNGNQHLNDCISLIKGKTIIRPTDWTADGFAFPANESERCAEPYCHSKSVEYGASKDQISALTDLSVDCHQEIQHECNLNALTGYSSWTDRNGQVNHYWHGNASAESSDTGCECSSNSSCNISLSPDCNCNSFLPNSSDRGIIYSLSKLPIMKLNYGGSISPYSLINFRLGPLICSGKSTFYPSEMAEAERKQLKDPFIKYYTLSSH